MKKIIHISDLHFNRVDQSRVEALHLLIRQITPNVVVVSGDLTQRAKKEEFIAAKGFLDGLELPMLVVPGNHDIPLYNLIERFYSPLKRYTKFITSDLVPFYADNEIAIIGLVSARKGKILSGSISERQLERAETLLGKLDEKIIKIVVTHHPFDIPQDTTHTHAQVIAHSTSAMMRLSKIGIDLFLSGHLHVFHAGDTTTRYVINGYSGLIIHAGTAFSTRVRSGPVSFNLITVDAEHIIVENYAGNTGDAGYSIASLTKFTRGKDGWKIVAS